VDENELKRLLKALDEVEVDQPSRIAIHEWIATGERRRRKELWKDLFKFWAVASLFFLVLFAIGIASLTAVLLIQGFGAFAAVVVLVVLLKEGSHARDESA